MPYSVFVIDDQEQLHELKAMCTGGSECWLDDLIWGMNHNQDVGRMYVSFREYSWGKQCGVERITPCGKLAFEAALDWAPALDWCEKHLRINEWGPNRRRAI